MTFTATVTVALPPTTIDPVPTGTVTFYDNGASIGTGTLSVVNGQDQATFTTSTLSTASHSITAAYTSGDGNFIPSPVSTAISAGRQQGEYQHDRRLVGHPVGVTVRR